MATRKRFLLLAGILLIAATMFTFGPMRSATALAAPAASDPCPPNQNTGSNDTWVQVLQFTLNSFDWHGVIKFKYFPLATDGDFGSQTTTDVHEYQQDVMGISPGEVGEKTWGSLGFCTVFTGQSFGHYGVSGGTHCPGTLSEGSSGTWVQALQYALNVDADSTAIPINYGNTVWAPLATDGSFGSLTKAGVQALQQEFHITTDGSVGPQTWGVMAFCYT